MMNSTVTILKVFWNLSEQDKISANQCQIQILEGILIQNPRYKFSFLKNTEKKERGP